MSFETIRSASDSDQEFGKDQPLMITSAGMSCTDYCSGGSNLRAAGATERPHAVLIADRQNLAEQCLEDCCFGENTDRYPVVLKQRDPLKCTHITKFVKA